MSELRRDDVGEHSAQLRPADQFLDWRMALGALTGGTVGVALVGAAFAAMSFGPITSYGAPPILANWKVGYIGGSVLLAVGVLLVILPTLRAARVRAWTPQRTVRSALTRTAGIAGLSAIVLSVWLGQGAIGFSTGYLGLVFIVGVIPAIGVAALGCALANWFARSLPRTVGALAVWIVLIVLTIAWPLPEVVEDHSPGHGIQWQE